MGRRATIKLGLFEYEGERLFASPLDGASAQLSG
jgi:hypothetical protein